MAEVFTLIATDIEDLYFDENLIDGTYHVAINHAAPRTACGIQLDGDDGIARGYTVSGKITCQSCALVVREIKAIRDWQ